MESRLPISGFSYLTKFCVLALYLMVQDGKTALMWASENGHVEMVGTLLRRGASIDAEDLVWYLFIIFWSIHLSMRQR